MESLLRVEDLNVRYKSYRGELKVLDDVSFEVKVREKVGLIGESGCGKTTLLKSILRILPPNSIIYKGKIFFKNIEIIKANKNEIFKIRRENIGMIFQDPMSTLNPFFKVKDQLYDALRYSVHNIKSQQDLQQMIIKLLKEVALSDSERILESYPFELSGGMRQRVCIALALTRSNDLLLADEPTTNLDVTIQEQILNLLRELVNKRGLSIVLVSHALGMVKEFVDKIYVMYAGQIVETASTDKIFSEPLHPYTKLLLSAVPRLTGRWKAEGLIGRLPDYVNPPPGCRFYMRCQQSNSNCKIKPKLLKLNKDHSVACWLYGDEEH
ncbi:MAG: ABC transporter ATP-binding protein [bacterium]|nr:ABC transporter ATP-binding protein [bacterium]